MITQCLILVRKARAAASVGVGMCTAAWRSFLFKTTVSPASRLPRYGIFLTDVAATQNIITKIMENEPQIELSKKEI